MLLQLSEVPLMLTETSDQDHQSQRVLSVKLLSTTLEMNFRFEIGRKLVTSFKSGVNFLKARILALITPCEVIIARYDTILDKSERAHLYNQ